MAEDQLSKLWEELLRSTKGSPTRGSLINILELIKEAKEEGERYSDGDFSEEVEEAFLEKVCKKLFKDPELIEENLLLILYFMNSLRE